MLQRFARYVGKDADGRKVYRIPVVIIHNDSRGNLETWCNPPKREFSVISHSATAAANWARDNEAGNLPETEIHAWGPQGGRITRYIGWESAIMTEMFRARQPLTGNLFA